MKKAIYPIPRNSLVWLLASVGLCILPQLERLPVWMWGVTALCLYWRVQVFRQRWSYPRAPVKLGFILLGVMGVFWHYQTLFGPDAGVALLVLAYLFKLLELVKKRDAYLIVILSYFVLATNYLFDRGLLSTIYSLGVVIVVTAALVGLNQTQAHTQFRQTLKKSSTMLLQSVPLMVVLFVLVPRIDPLWNLNLGSEQAKTGLSEEMSPGDISKLSRSAELAFRVEFEGDIPSRDRLYWRGVVFSRFDGRTWYVDTTSKYNDDLVFDKSQVILKGKTFRYKVILDATFNDWLYVMPYGVVDLALAEVKPDMTWILEGGVDTDTIYHVTSYPDFEWSMDHLKLEDQEKYLQLPARTNPQTREFALKLLARANGDAEKFIKSILEWINVEEFQYTLTPPKLYGATIDQFLFQTRQGFCAHYAGAMVFLLRSVGIPARMIGGYQGGQMHPSGEYMLVHQYDAHAWVEAWIPGHGWRRYDPTAAIAPSRIIDGPQNATTDSSFLAASPLSPNRLRNVQWVSRLRNYWDYTDYLWTKWVVGYNQDVQYQFLTRLLGSVTTETMGYLLAACAGLFILIFLLILYLERKKIKIDPLDRLYLEMCKRLEARGIVRRVGEGVEAFSQRVAREKPQYAESVASISKLYQRVKYAPAYQQDTECNSTTAVEGDMIRDTQRAIRRRLRSIR